MTDLSQPPTATQYAKPREPRPRLAIQFRGRAGEYFGIWIVNVLLTFVTLGIFWPWSFVRTRRYFLESTWLEESPFVYHATGGQIFRGWLIVVGVVILINLSSFLHPLAPAGMWLLILPAVPWLLNRSLRFQARMMSWRGVHFNFQGHYGKAALVFLVMPMVSALSLGLLVPLTTAMQSRYIINHYRFGTSAFTLPLRNGAFYRAALWLFILNILFLVIVVVLAAYLVSFIDFSSFTDDEHSSSGGAWAALGGLVAVPWLLVLGFGVGGMFYRVIMRNLVVSHMELDPRHRFRSDLSVLEYPLKSFFGWMLVSMTFGLMYPWYKCMLWRTQCEALTVLPAQSIDAFVDDMQAASPSAFGDQAVDVLGFHVGI